MSNDSPNSSTNSTGLVGSFLPPTMITPTDYVCHNTYTKEEVLSRFTEFDLMESHHDGAVTDLRNVIILVNDKKVNKIDMIDSTCAERSPCIGHGGVDIYYDDGSVDTYECGSVSIGAIMTYYQHVYGNNIVINKHCCPWISEKFKTHLIETFSS